MRVSSEGRHSKFGYDARGRLQSAILGSSDPNASPSAALAGGVSNNLKPWDQRDSQTRTPRLDAGTRSVLAAKGVDLSAIDPPSVGTPEQPGHKISAVNAGTSSRTVQYDNGGGQVSDDGQFLYAWDEKGRLTSATQKPTAIGTLHRVEYFYDGNNRMVGRRAESAMLGSLSDPPSGLTWSLETDPNLLSGVGLPAETTFVWDPISDTIISVFDSNPSSTDPNGGLLKQIIHGGLAYDDPIEVTTVTPNSQTSLQRLYPVYDEAGDGTLQAVLNANGQLVARNLPADAYGADQLDVAGAAVDRVDVQATKDATGNVRSVDVTVHSTESLASATVATGLRLATVDSNGGVVKTSTITPALVPNDAYAARFTLTAADWTTLTDPTATSVAGLPAQALSVAVTNTLRAQAWSAETPLLPAPNWAKASGSTFSSSTFPVEVRDSLSGVTTFIAGIASSASDTRVLYHVDNLALLGSTSSGTGSAIEDTLAARFQAQPFSDPFTGKNYVRERWYDPVTGTWLSPDQLGYKDSANLYAFAAGDPVNSRDPLGLAASIGLSGTIVATDNRNGGRIVRFTPAEIAADPQGVRTFLGVNADVDPREADALIARAGQAASLTNPGLRAAARGAMIAKPGVDAAAHGLRAMSAVTGVGVAAQITQSYIEQGATKTNIAMTGLAVFGLGASDELIALGNVAREARAARIAVTNASGVGRQAAREFGETLAANPAATAAYGRIQRTGYDVVLDFGENDEGLMGLTEGGSKGTVTIFGRAHSSVDEMVETLIHESRHAARAARGQAIGTFADEVGAAKLEFFYKYARRPTLEEVASIVRAVKRAYPELQ